MDGQELTLIDKIKILLLSKSVELIELNTGDYNITISRSKKHNKDYISNLIINNKQVVMTGKNADTTGTIDKIYELYNNMI